MEDSSPHFSYKPLADDAIRLVTIKPGPWDSIIECEVDARKLDAEEGCFRALSYVWGDAKVRRTVRLNGRDFEVTVNLYEGLRQMRESIYETEDLPMLPVWIDAICINQEDKNEKAKQVPNMHQIYNTAEEVLLWLGTMPIPSDFLKPWIGDDKYSWMGFDKDDCPMSEELRKEALERYVVYVRSPQFPIQRLSRQPTGNARKHQLMHFAMASALRHCSYFQRLWTAQEAVLAKNGPVILVDRHVLTWDQFTHKDRLEPEESVEVIGRPHTSFRGISSLRKEMAAERFSPMYQFRLLRVIRDFSGLACSEAVDKIYGLLAMVPLHALPKDLWPDYNLPCQEIYWKYAKFIFHSTSSLSLLERYTEPVPGVPSWVPAIGMSENNIGEIQTAVFPNFTADCREMAISGHDLGVCMDRLERPSAISRPEDLDRIGRSMDLRETFRQLENRIWVPYLKIRHDGEGGWGSNRWEKITSSGFCHARYNLRAKPPYNEELFRPARQMNLEEMQNFISQSPDHASYALRSWREMAAFAWTTLITDRGVMWTFRDHLWLDGLQPQRGDLIFKPNGMNSAVFLRQEADGKFRLIGRLTNGEETPYWNPRTVTLV
ncbi:hypothetical protein ACHAPT_012509 [Fusarium lateritium]